MIKIEQIQGFSRSAQRFLTPSSETIPTSKSPPTTAQPGWQSAVVEDLSIAHEMLDRLERNGYADRQLRILDDARFEILWR